MNFDDDDDNGGGTQPNEYDLPSSHPAMAGGRARKSRKGWLGEELELEHQRERIMIASGSGDGIHEHPASATAVDLNQFRNTEVGEGYQAKHVVRQRTAAAPSSTTTTISIAEARPNARESHCSNKLLPLTKEALLQNRGLREFRKEIESILSSP